MLSLVKSFVNNDKRVLREPYTVVKTKFLKKTISMKIPLVTNPVRFVILKNDVLV